jgi:hypothetical protein
MCRSSSIDSDSIPAIMVDRVRCWRNMEKVKREALIRVGPSVQSGE